MPATEQPDVPSVTDPRPSYALHQNRLEIQNSTLQRLDRGTQPNVGIRGNRHSLPPNFPLPHAVTVDISAPSLLQAREVEYTLDEATIANRTAALRRLNGVASRNRRADTTGTRTSFSSQPIVVRTYSGSTTSRPSSEQRVSATMYDKASSKNEVEMPAADVFSFENILQAIEQEARDDVDAIAEICGRSKMSLANEYGAHMPPQSELMAARQGGHASIMRSSLNQTLTPVEEASSINERLGGAQTIQQDASEVRQYQDNVHNTHTTRQRDGGNGEAGTGQRASFTSPYPGSTVTPTKSQQKLLRQSTLPVMLCSESVVSAKEEATTGTSLADNTLASVASEPAKEPLPQSEELHVGGSSRHSQRRQSSLLGSLPPWLSWTGKSTLAGGHHTQNAASSLRSILDKKGNEDKMEIDSVRSIA